MAHHVFLTGAKQAGKSTLLKKVLALFPGSPAGFRTLRTRDYRQETWTVHMLPADGSSAPTAENLLFVCGCQRDDTLSRFDSLGPALLDTAPASALILMDELGPHEEGALEFHRAVWSALEGAIPVLGVLQQPLSPFLLCVAQRQDVTLMTITEENRDDPELPRRILEQLKQGNPISQ